LDKLLLTVVDSRTHPSKTLSPRCSVASGKMQNLNDLQRQKASLAMCVTVGGRKTACTDLQLWKAAHPMYSRLVDNRMDLLRESQSLKAPFSIRVTVSGIVTGSRDPQPIQMTDDYLVQMTVDCSVRMTVPMTVHYLVQMGRLTTTSHYNTQYPHCDAPIRSFLF